METKQMQVRDWECGCGHTWTAPMVVSAYTSRLSGEATQWCPKCGKRPVLGWPARNAEESDDAEV